MTIPNSVTSIGDGAFCGCTNLTSVTIPDSVTSIDFCTFSGCTSLTSVTIPDSVTSIDFCTFSGCTSLTSVTIPDSVTSIGNSAFYKCESLTSVTIPDGVTYIGGGAFSECTSLSGIWVDEDNEYYSSDEYGVLFNKYKTILIKAPGAIVKYTIPDSVTSIGSSAFNYCTSLTSVTIPDGVTYIGYRAFSECTSLSGIWVDEDNEYYSSDEYGVLFDKDKTTLLQAPRAISKYTIPNTVTSIGYWAFEYCTSLTSVTIPDSVTSIGDWTFSGCTSLTSVTIPDSVTSIGDWTFSGCTSLTSVTIPDSVTSIGDWTFYECSNLKSVYFLGDAPEIGSAVFLTYDPAWQFINIPDLVLYYIEGKDGWTTPEWNGYPTAIHTHTYDNSGRCSVCGYAAVDAFEDIPDDVWYVSAVNYVVDNGLMNGMGKNEFRPEEAMTRAMLVTVLWRYAGSPAEGENTFNDLTQDWYVQAVAWASMNGIVNGYPDGTFKPDEKVTREQLATIVYRYCNTVGIDTSARADLSTFPDANKVNSYASDAISWAVSVGLVTGITHGGNPTAYLEPQTSATRAQVATILMRFIENVAN